MNQFEIILGTVNITIRCSGKSRELISTSGCKVTLFGFPLLDNDIIPDLHDSFEEFLQRTKGYFAFIHHECNKITISTDITGGYRLYISRAGTNILISDDFYWLVNQTSAPGLSWNENEYLFWVRHRYTTGRGTFFNEIEKLEPASIYSISVEGVNKRCWFPYVKHYPSVDRHVQLVHEDLLTTFEGLKKLSHHCILFFSGGIDSLLLAMLAKEYHLSHSLVFLRSNPRYHENEKDVFKALAGADFLGKPLEMIEVDLHLSDTSRLRKISHYQILDRHLCLLHYGGMEDIRNRYGDNCIVVNGQSSDSILSFGPSSHGIGGIARRILMLPETSLLLKRIATVAIKAKKHSKNYSIPVGLNQFLEAFFDEESYIALIDRNRSQDYSRYLQSFITEIKDVREDVLLSVMMRLKLFGFLQGSDNQVVLRSAHSVGIHQVIMPYATPGIVLGTARHKDYWQDLWRPKYPIQKIMERFCKIPKQTRSKRAIKNSNGVWPLDNLEKIMDTIFEEESNRLREKKQLELHN